MKMRKWLAAIAALIMTVCLLAGACAEGDPNALLEEDLKITDAIREAFWNERLIDTRKEYVEDAGITVMLDECVGDAHHIRAAFRVSGRHFTEDDRPEFRHIRIEVPGLDNDEPASSGFINWVENGRILWNDRAGDATFFFAAYTDQEGFSFDEKEITVTLETLGIEGVQKPVANGKWVFSWDLRCSEKKQEWTGLDLEIPDAGGAKLNDVAFGPMHLTAHLTVPGHPGVDAPYVSGFVLKDGTRIEHAMESVSTGPVEGAEELVEEACFFNRVIDPDQVAALLIGSHAWGYGASVFVELP